MFLLRLFKKAVSLVNTLQIVVESLWLISRAKKGDSDDFPMFSLHSWRKEFLEVTSLSFLRCHHHNHFLKIPNSSIQ